MRLLLTRAAGGSPRLPAALAAAGFEVVECPLIEIVPIDGPPHATAGYDWLVLTSARAVPLALARLRGQLPPVAVVGPATAGALRDRGVEPALVARRSSQDGLVEELRGTGPPPRVLFAGAEAARDVLARSLGAEVLPLYRTVERRVDPLPPADLVLLASPSAARSLAAHGSILPCVAIGPVTAAEARRAGVRLVAEAKTPDAEAVVQAVRLAGSRLASSRS